MLKLRQIRQQGPSQLLWQFKKVRELRRDRPPLRPLVQHKGQHRRQRQPVLLLMRLHDLQHIGQHP